ncbi:MAG: LysE family transporter [Anaerolineae bacterium]|nr:LysE family transporter [Anaerolineae bacterium]
MLFLSAMGLSFSFCAAPGIVNTEAIRRGFARGYRPALMVELGSLIGDATWAVIALAGLAFVAQSALARVLLGFAGSAVLAYLAWRAIRDARQGIMPEPDGTISGGDFATGAFLSLGNPFAVAFWLGVSGSVISTTTPNPRPEHFIVFFVGFMLGGLLWSISLPGLVAWGRQLLKPTFYRWVNLLCGMLLGYFCIQLLWDTIMSL